MRIIGLFSAMLSLERAAWESQNALEPAGRGLRESLPANLLHPTELPFQRFSILVIAEGGLDILFLYANLRKFVLTSDGKEARYRLLSFLNSG